MAHDPLSPSEALRTRPGLALVGLAVFALAYSIVIAAQLLVGLSFFAVLVGLYVLYRVIAVLDSFADAAQRLVALREKESDVGRRARRRR